MKKVTSNFLKKHNACSDGFKWWKENCKNLTTEEQLQKLLNYRADWASWLMVRLLPRKDKIRYAVFAAEQVIEIYEKKYPHDKRPREAIEASKKVIERDSQKNAASNAAAYAASYAANAAYAACKKIQVKIIEFGISLLK